MDKTIQRGDMDDHGLLFKIIPKHDNPEPSKKNFRGCWIRKVPAWDPIQGQSIIPTNLSEFKVRNLLSCFQKPNLMEFNNRGLGISLDRTIKYNASIAR